LTFIGLRKRWPVILKDLLDGEFGFHRKRIHQKETIAKKNADHR
jgi:hypothetical protein